MGEPAGDSGGSRRQAGSEWAPRSGPRPGSGPSCRPTYSLVWKPRPRAAAPEGEAVRGPLASRPSFGSLAARPPPPLCEFFLSGAFGVSCAVVEMMARSPSGL